MDCFARVPVTAAVFACLASLLSGCIAYDAASTVVHAGSTVVGTSISVVRGAGDIAVSPFEGSDSDKKQVR